MYYVVHKFPNPSRVTIHFDTHGHPVVDSKCRESFQKMKSMVEDKVYHMPITTTLTIILSTNKTFLFCHLFNEDGKGLVEVLKGQKLDQMMLKFVPLCSFGIHKFIASLKHCLSTFNSIDYILKLKTLSRFDYIQNNYFFSQQVGLKVYLFKMSINGATFKFWFGPTYTNGRRFAKCMDDVRSRKMCSTKGKIGVFYWSLWLSFSHK